MSLNVDNYIMREFCGIMHTPTEIRVRFYYEPSWYPTILFLSLFFYVSSGIIGLTIIAFFFPPSRWMYCYEGLTNEYIAKFNKL